MKLGFIIPVLAECDVTKCYDAVKSACDDCKVDYDIIFAFNGKLNSLFAKVRSAYIDIKNVKAFKVDKNVNEHKLITIAMQDCEKYNATIIYSAKEDTNQDVIKAFIASWKAGNKLVYLKKIFYGPKRWLSAIKEMFYKLGVKLLNCFYDYYAETDIQLLDQDVVKTINQLPAKNRQLRTLDSFVGYNYDIIRMEVDSKLKDSKYYHEKTKAYKVFAWLTVIVTLLATIDLAAVIILLSIGINIGLAWWIVLFVAFACLNIAMLLFSTKRTLLLRVGSKQDVAELDLLKSKMERYNF